jgi:hypothetical protein
MRRRSGGATEQSKVSAKKRSKNQATPVNLPVDTAPLPKSAASFRDKTLKQLSARRLIIKPSLGMRIFAAAFLAVGAVPLGIAVYRLSRNPNQTEYWVLGAFGLVFFTAGLLAFILPRRFDFDLDREEMRVLRLWFGSHRPLSQISGIQVIHGGWHTQKTRTGAERTYCSYQLNLILNDPDKPRMNLTNHPDWDSTWQAGRALADFLQLPFLDSVSEEK